MNGSIFYQTIIERTLFESIVGKESQMFMNIFSFSQAVFYCIRDKLNPLPDDKILGRSKLKQIADDFFKCI